MRKNSQRRKCKTEERPKITIKEKVTEILELPKEVVLNVPKLTMVGMGSLIIENYKGVIEYGDKRVRINTGIGIIKITGERIEIKEITSEDILINGEIQGMEFLR